MAFAGNLAGVGPMKRDSFTLLLFCLMAVVVFCAGCEDDSTCRPEVSAGRIEGYALAGGRALDGVIAAIPIIDGAAVDSVFETVPDSRGFYTLDLPRGRYVVKLRVHGGYRWEYDYSMDGLGYGQIAPDTLRVDEEHSPRRIDFELGRMEVQLDLADVLDDEMGEVVLHRRETPDTGQWRTFVDGGSNSIMNGRLFVQIEGILPGEYRVEFVLGRRYYLCDCPYDGEHLWMPGIRDPENSPWYEIGTTESLILTAGIAAAPARIEGRIVGAWQEMGVTTLPAVSIVGTDSVPIVGGRSVEDDGTFCIDVLLPGSVKLAVTQEGICQWFGGASFAEAETYTLELGETISDVELVQCGLRVQLTGPRLLVLGEEYRLYDPVDLSLLATAMPQNTADHDIALPNLWPGEYLLYVTPNSLDLGSTDWQPQWYDRARAPEAARVISIGSVGEIVSIEVALEMGDGSAVSSKPIPTRSRATGSWLFPKIPVTSGHPLSPITGIWRTA